MHGNIFTLTTWQKSTTTSLGSLFDDLDESWAPLWWFRSTTSKSQFVPNLLRKLISFLSNKELSIKKISFSQAFGRLLRYWTIRRLVILGTLGVTSFLDLYCCWIRNIHNCARMLTPRTLLIERLEQELLKNTFLSYGSVVYSFRVVRNVHFWLNILCLFYEYRSYY